MNKYEVLSMKYEGYKSIFNVLLVLVLTIYCLLSTIYLANAETLSSNDLIEKAKELDGKIVAYKGELVTSVLNRGEYSWVNLNDGTNAIGVWCKTSDLKPIAFIGGYGVKGDILEVKGAFRRACPLHGGELDIHAEYIKLLESGYCTGETVDARKIVIAAALFLIILCAVIMFRKRM
jgi:hypothetical protein